MTGYLKSNLLIGLLGALSVPIAAEETFIDKTISEFTVAQVVDSVQGVSPHVWTYDDCVNWAAEHNLDIRRSILSVLEADQNVLEAKDAWLPTVSFGMSHSYTNYPSPVDGMRGNVYGSSYGVNAQWTAWEGNIRKYRLESAKLILKQQQLAGDDVMVSIKLGILQAYLNILYAEEAIDIASQTLEVSTAQSARAYRLMESGRTSRVDYAQIESQRAQDAYNLEQARSNYNNAILTLKQILELNLKQGLEVSEVNFPDSEIYAELLPQGSIYDIAAGWLPNLKSNELNKEIYENDIKIAKAGRLPTISVSGSLGTGYTSGGSSWGSQMGHGFNEGIGVNLSVPIYDANSTKRKVAQAKLASLDYELNREQLLNDLSNTIEGLYIDAENARAKYESGKIQLEATRLTSELVDRQFELGLVNPLELLTAHNNYLNARLELLQCKYMAILSNKTINYYATRQITLP